MKVVFKMSGYDFRCLVDDARRRARQYGENGIGWPSLEAPYDYDEKQTFWRAYKDELKKIRKEKAEEEERKRREAANDDNDDQPEPEHKENPLSDSEGCLTILFVIFILSVAFSAFNSWAMHENYGIVEEVDDGYTFTGF